MLPTRRGHDGSTIKTLKQHCVFTLIQYRHLLGDVGWMDSDALVQVLSACTAEQLAAIEDTTLADSQRSLCWYTWHLWYNHYRNAYGPVPANVQLLQLHGDPPEDYSPPKVDFPLGAYRMLYEAKAADVAARISRASGKLRSTYDAEQRLKSSRTVVETAQLPPPKRQRVMSSQNGARRGSAAASSGPNIGGQPRGKVLASLGLKANRAGAGSLGRGGTGRPSTQLLASPPQRSPLGGARAAAGALLPLRAGGGAAGRPSGSGGQLQQQPRPGSASQASAAQGTAHGGQQPGGPGARRPAAGSASAGLRKQALDAPVALPQRR